MLWRVAAFFYFLATLPPNIAIGTFILKKISI